MQTLLLVVSMTLLAVGQILQKRGAMLHLEGKRRPREWAQALWSPELLGAGVCLVAGTLTWLVVLFHMDVSRAFPVLSFGSILVLVASRLYLREPVPLHRWAGAVLIAIGVALVSAS